MSFTYNFYLSNWASFCMQNVFFLMFYFSFVCVYSPPGPYPSYLKISFHLTLSHPPCFHPQNALLLSISHPSPKEVSPSPLQWPIRRLWGRFSRSRGWGAQCRYCLHRGVAFWVSVTVSLCLSHTHSSVTLSLAPLDSEHTTDGGSAVPWRYHVF